MDRQVVNVAYRVSPGKIPTLLPQRLHRWLVDPLWPQRLDRVYRLQAAHEDDNPKHIRLAHAQRRHAQQHRADVAQHRAAIRANARQVVCEGREHHACRQHVRVVQPAKEEYQGKEANVNGRVYGILRKGAHARRRREEAAAAANGLLLPRLDGLPAPQRQVADA